MPRRWLAYLTLTLALAGGVLVPASASAAGHVDPPTAPACTKDTAQLKDLGTVLNNLASALGTMPPDTTKISQAAGDLFQAVGAAQTAGCLPALPSTPAPTNPPPSPLVRTPQRASGPTDCQADAIALLSAALGVITAATANPPNPTAVPNAATALASAVTAINTDNCTPNTLPVPTVPSGLPPLAPAR